MSAVNSELEQSRYVSLATFRRSGVAVATPVWAACDGDSYFVFSAGDAGKIKRLRNARQARMAKCDARGKLLGDWHDAQAQILLDDEQIQRALMALRKKYGIQMWIADVAAKVLGRFDKRAYIALQLAD